MRILLINTNRERCPYPVMPIGLACVAQALEQDGHAVTVADLTFASDPLPTVAGSVATCRPELIGLSIRNLDNSTYASPHSYLPEVQEIAACCRQVSDAPLLIGGAAVSIAPAALLRRLQADFAVAGEGEATATALARALAAGARPPAIPGLLQASDRGAGPTLPQRTALPGLHNLPRYVDVRRYLRRGAPLPLQSRRGCAFRCVYCTYPAIEGTIYRVKEAGRVAAEVEELSRRTGCRSFEFVDSTFNAPLPHALQVCEALARLPLRLHLQASGFTPARSAPELLAAMRRAGFRTLVCSPDSAADPVLQALDKGFQRQDLERLVDQVHQAGMVTMWAFLFGGPGETEDTARQTLRFISRRLSGSDLVFIAAGVRIYPGTPLERLARADGLLAPDDDLLAPRFYLSPQLSLRRLGALFDEHLAGARNCVYLSDLQCSLVPWLERAMAALGAPPPLWRYTPYLRRLIPRRSRALPEAAPGAGGRER